MADVMNKQRLFCFFMIITLSGCSTLQSVRQKYGEVNFEDGIDRKEAKIIAQMHFWDNELETKHSLRSAKVYSSDEILSLNSSKESFVLNEKIYQNKEKKLKYPNSWYISFKPKFLNLFSEYYLLVLNKDAGIVEYAYDSNVLIFALKEIINNEEVKISTALLIGKYYQEKNTLPDNIGQLKRFYSQKISDGLDQELNLKNFEIRRISDNRLKVRIIPEKRVNHDDLKMNIPSKGEYDLEVKSVGEKIMIQTSGSISTKFELTPASTNE